MRRSVMNILSVRSAWDSFVPALAIGCVLTEFVWAAQAATTLTIIDQPIHFMASDGSDVVAEAGTYQVDAADSRLSLTAEGRTPLFLDAQATTHNEKIESPLAVLVPGDDLDVLHVVLLLPNGQALDAPGSRSGVLSRAASRAPLSALTIHERGTVQGTIFFTPQPPPRPPGVPIPYPNSVGGSVR